MNLLEMIDMVRLRTGGDATVLPRPLILELLNEGLKTMAAISVVVRGIFDYTFSSTQYPGSAIPLPPGVMRITDITFGGKRLERKTRDEFLQSYKDDLSDIDEITDLGEPTGYVEWANRIELVPRCDSEQEGKEVRLYVVKQPALLESNTDTIDARIPIEYRDAPVEFAVWKCTLIPKLYHAGISDRAQAEFGRLARACKVYADTELTPSVDWSDIHV